MKTINLGSGASQLARNRCTNCGKEWLDKPVGFAQHQACPNCGSVYWEWLNHEQFKNRRK